MGLSVKMSCCSSKDFTSGGCVPAVKLSKMQKADNLGRSHAGNAKCTSKNYKYSQTIQGGPQECESAQ